MKGLRLHVAQNVPLDRYRELTSGCRAHVTLDQDQAAAVLKAHDFGIAALAPEEVAILNQVMSVLKEEIWP